MINAYYTVLEFPCKAKGKFCLYVRTNERTTNACRTALLTMQSMLTLFSFKGVMALQKSSISFNLVCFPFPL